MSLGVVGMTGDAVADDRGVLTGVVGNGVTAGVCTGWFAGVGDGVVGITVVGCMQPETIKTQPQS